MVINLGTVKPVKIEEEMRGSYLDYAMSVIVARALPDVRDGLKPVHRRILYAMNDLNLQPSTPYKKSARIVGEVLGKYHPHGDSPVYDAMVRMTQDFSMRYPLIDGQGNFGSVDNDPPAAMRYTEARQTHISTELLADIDMDTVDFTPNFDDSLQEPVVLPSRIPNLLVNGSSGIAVGMATNIPPHNLGEICDGIMCLIDDPDASIEELLQIVHGPDFPTRAEIWGKEGIRNAYTTGHGKIIIRAKAVIEEIKKGGRSQIIISELPYQLNKATLVERIAILARDHKIDGIAEIRDESDRDGIRIVVELKRDEFPEQVLNNLYLNTSMQTSYFLNMLALVDGAPRVLNLRALLQYFIDFRREVVARRSRFELRKAQERAHILEGMKIALDNLDAIIALIRQSPSVEDARINLMQMWSLTQIQAQAILDMQLRRIAQLERQKIDDEYTETIKKIGYLEDLLDNPRKVLLLVKDEIVEIKAKYADPRRTVIMDQEVGAFSKEDLIAHSEVVVTLSHRGYIKRMPKDTYKVQRRGGRGVAGMKTRDTDEIQHLILADTHDILLFFTNKGRVASLKCYDVPPALSRTARGIAINNLINMEEGERITAPIQVIDFEPGEHIVMASRNGQIKKTPLHAFANIRGSGIIALRLDTADELVSVALATDDDEYIIVTKKGQALRAKVDGLRSASRYSGGVRGIKLTPKDKVIAMDIVDPDKHLITLSIHGYGKLTPLRSYRTQSRGGHGLLTFRVNPKTGPLVAARVVDRSHELIIISAQGQVERIMLKGISVQGRITQGVSIMRPDSGDTVAALACSDPNAEQGNNSNHNGRVKE
ncbi:MAG: DNA gyrase subunit A [Chloroflexi bacterium]|nr:DNA gyrase subunit A [Chloroflexota bacterium]